MEKFILEEPKSINNIHKRNQRIILNFMNSHDLYFFRNSELFRKSLDPAYNINSIDGFTISIFLSIKKLRKIKRLTGPDFTYNFFKNNKSHNKKMLFLGIEEDSLDLLVKKFPVLDRKNLFSYNLPYINDIKFPSSEIEKISRIINSKKIDIIWVGLGCPKQYILSYSLLKKTKSKYFFNVGAAIDFLLEKKKRSPKFFRSLGLEWLYRLITDYKKSKKKVLRSLLALKYLNLVDIKR